VAWIFISDSFGWLRLIGSKKKIRAIAYKLALVCMAACTRAENPHRELSVDRFDPGLIGPPMVCTDGFWSGVKITMDGLGHLAISWPLVGRELVTLAFCSTVDCSVLNPVNAVTNCFAASCVDGFNHRPGHSVHSID